MRCIGISGGSLQEKIRFVQSYAAAQNLAAGKLGASSTRGLKSTPNTAVGDGHPYIYLDEWEGEALTEALGTGVTLAIHPHMFKQIQTSADAEDYFSRYKDKALHLLPDTAHLTVAGEDVVQVIDHYYQRIDAIHLKDWSGENGRAYRFYVRGFVELGQGDVLLENVIKYLKHRSFMKWVVVEQDVARDPFASACASRRWLRERGI